MMKELDARMLQFILSVARYIHSYREKKDFKIYFLFFLFFSILLSSKDRGQG